MTAMKTYTSPGGRGVDPGVNVVRLLMDRAAASPDHPALAYRDGDGFTEVTTRQFLETVMELAAGLVAAGIRKGDHVALHSSTRIEFTYFDYAIWAAGAVSTTIYETSSPEQVQWIISDSGSVALVTENEETFAVFEEVEDDLPGCRSMFVIDNGAIDALQSMATDKTRAEVARRIEAIAHDDIATLVYTSGTTGNPKGCVLTHYNVTWAHGHISESFSPLLSEGNRTLMFLPLAHIFARALQSLCVATGTTMYYSSGIPSLAEELPMAKPTWVFSVPRVFEKIYNGAKANADASGKGPVFDKAVATAIAYSEAVQRGRITIGTKLAHRFFDKLVYSKLRGAFGGYIEYAISGGAPLGARLGHFFRGAGIVVLEGYGLTETTATATVNRPGQVKIGTVGQPVPGMSIAIADDGEVLIKGGVVFSGYWNNDEATSTVLDADGWFRSGDLGSLDADGYLSITGRKKEIIITSAGKNVAPAVLEDRMRSHPLVSQVLVVGDARPFIAALVTLDDEALAGWAVSRGDKTASPVDLHADPDVIAEVQAAVDEANRAVSQAEAIKEFRILPHDLSIEGGELTPTLKVKRSVVAAKYADVIEDIYGSVSGDL
jgi:long-chain acyl-CoA synthetase